MTIQHGGLTSPANDTPADRSEFLLLRYLDYLLIVPISLYNYLFIFLPPGNARTRAASRVVPLGFGMALAVLLFTGLHGPVIKGFFYVVFLALSGILSVEFATILRTRQADRLEYKTLRRDARFLAGLLTG